MCHRCIIHDIRNSFLDVYKRQRQAAITQEITEIVGGVNAMEGANT